MPPVRAGPARVKNAEPAVEAKETRPAPKREEANLPAGQRET